jgi:hypothetical protein
MTSLWRWAFVYLGLLLLLVGLGHLNRQRERHLFSLQAQLEQAQTQEGQLLLERYKLLSPTAIRQWADQHGYIPMSIANWGGHEP